MVYEMESILNLLLELNTSTLEGQLFSLLVRKNEIIQSSLNGLASNLSDSTGRSFATSFSAQSGAASPVFHHTGTIQGLHNLHESFNVPNMSGTLASRNSTINNVPSSWVQQPTGSLSSGHILWKLTWSFSGDK
ncbi:unnamed protein product [Camellia sinensis]